MIFVEPGNPLARRGVAKNRFRKEFDVWCVVERGKQNQIRWLLTRGYL
jgi:hypothetical protein